MKLLVFPDCHFGYASGTELENDTYELAREALKRTEADIIILVGDVFDSRTPTIDTLTRTIEVFLRSIVKENPVKIINTLGKNQENISPLSRSGTPLVAIHGTHERRARGLLNPVQAMERSGFLIHLHCNGIVFEKNGEKICVQGMSGVPEQYASDVLKQWNPKPEKNCFNIFLIHQNIKKFVFSPYGIDLEEFPEDFDIYISGHIHEPQKTIYRGKPLIITGSLVPTQITKETVKPRGFWIIDSLSGKIEFVEFVKQRKVYYKEFENVGQEEIENYINEILSKNHDKKPLIRIKVSNSKFSDNEIKQKYHEKSLISFRKEIIENELPIRSLEEHKLSVQEMGKKLLRENLEKFGLEKEIFENIFELLLHKKYDDVMELLNKGSLKKEISKINS